MRRPRGTWLALAGFGVFSSLYLACVVDVTPLSTTTGTDTGTGTGTGTSTDTTTDGQAIVASIDASNVPPGSWINVTANLANMPSECGNMTSVTAKPDEDLLIAGIALDGLWGSRDGGTSWQALGTADGGAVITNRPTNLQFDPQVPSRFWEAGIYHPGGVYETTDDGISFTQLGDLDTCDVVSVDLTDPLRKTLLAGGHEMAQTLYKSTDGGMTWTNVGAGLPDATYCVNPVVLGPSTYLVGCDGGGGGPTGIYLSVDGGMTWTVQTSVGGQGAPLRASDGSIYWPIPLAGGLTRSADGGMTWTQVIMGDVLSVTPVELPDGRIATLGYSSVLVSSDHGVTWKAASAALPYNDAAGITYSAQEKAFFIWHLTCGFNGSVPVPADAIQRFDFDYTMY